MNLTKCFSVLVAVCLLTLGCNSRGYKVVQVAGTITLDGKPLAGASIQTQPRGKGDETPGPGSFAQSDTSGKFTLELVDPPEPGAVPGEHSVTITTAGFSADPTSDEIDNPADRNKLPARYEDGSFLITIPDEDTTDLKLELTTKR